MQKCKKKESEHHFKLLTFLFIFAIMKEYDTRVKRSYFSCSHEEVWLWDPQNMRK